MPLGWVRHSSSPSVLGRAGEFIVATGPVWFGGAAILLLVRALVGPAPFESLSGAESVPSEFIPYVLSVFRATSALASRACALWHWRGFLDIVLVYLIVCIASEVTLSGPDFQGMWVGVAAICMLVVVGNLLPFFDILLETGMRHIRPWLFLLHATLAFAVLLDFCFYSIFRAVDAFFGPGEAKKKGRAQ